MNNKSPPKTKHLISNNFLLSSVNKSLKISSKINNESRNKSSNLSSLLSTNKIRFSEYINKKLNEKIVKSSSKSPMTLLASTALNQSGSGKNNDNPKKRNVTPLGLINIEKKVPSRNNALQSTLMNMSSNDVRTITKEGKNDNELNFRIRLKKPMICASLNKSRNKEMELSKFNMSIENEHSMFISRKSPKHHLKSYHFQDSKIVSSIDNNNVEIISYLKTDTFNDPIDPFEKDKKLTENGNMKINNMDTSFTDNIQMNMIETISDNVFFKDQRYIDLVNRNAILKEEIDFQSKNIEDFKIMIGILNYYISELNKKIKSDKHFYEKSIEIMKKEKEETMEKYKYTLKENNDLKQKLLQIFTAINTFENTNFDTKLKENDVLVQKILRENEYLRQITEKTIITEKVLKKEISSNDLINLEDFNTNYLEQYKKYKSNKIREELNFDTSIQTVQTEQIEDEKPFQMRSHFVPPLKKEKVKKQMKNKGNDTEKIVPEISENIFKSTNIFDEILLNLKLNCTLQNDVNKGGFCLPNSLNESFELSPPNDALASKDQKFY